MRILSLFWRFPFRVTPRGVFLVAAASILGLLGLPTLMIWVIVGIIVVSILDAVAVRETPMVTREVGAFARGVATPIRIVVEAKGASRVLVRQPLPPDMTSPAPSSYGRVFETTLVPLRRGSYVLPRVAVRSDGPLGLGSWFHELGEDTPFNVYPDLPAAQRLAQAVRQRSIRAVGSRRRGPLGLGTEFESVREYRTDDDVRQINWKATARLGRPMSNNLRVEQDVDLWILVDTGRLSAASMVASTGPVNRLDVGLDAAAALGLVADDLNDRVGFISYNSNVGRVLPPRRRGGARAIEAGYSLEPSDDETDHATAFASTSANRRGLVFLFTDLIDEAAATLLVKSLPSLCRRHTVIVACVDDPEYVRARIDGTAGEQMVMADIDASFDAAARLVRGAGAQVVTAPVDLFAEAIVRSYVRMRSGSGAASALDRPRQTTSAQ
jgi:uncharacterized protein (DUF58 family)